MVVALIMRGAVNASAPRSRAVRLAKAALLPAPPFDLMGTLLVQEMALLCFVWLALASVREHLVGKRFWRSGGRPEAAGEQRAVALTHCRPAFLKRL